MTQKSSLPSRREFLGMAGALAAAPYVITSSALGAGDQPAASDRITMALIGGGGRGRQIIGGGDQVVAVCDVDADHCAKAKKRIEKMPGNGGCATYGDFREILARDDIDGVVIATPDHWHTRIALSAIQAGKAVYVEKPLSLAIREGRILSDAVRRYRAILQVGSQQRSDEKFIKACELVRNGRIGKLQTVRVEIPTRGGSDEPWTPQPVPPAFDYDMWLGPAPWAPYHPDRCHYKFRFISDYSGGDVTNWGAHQLDIAQWGIGADDSGPLKVEGHGKQNTVGLHDAFYDIHVDFSYANDVKLELRSGGNGVRFHGTEGWIYVDRKEIKAEKPSVLDSPIGPDEIHLVRPPQSAGSNHMAVWLEAIRTRNTKILNVPAEIGHRSGTVCHLANIAMELKRPLRWDPAAEQFRDDDQANRMTWRPMRAPWQI